MKMGVLMQQQLTPQLSLRILSLSNFVLIAHYLSCWIPVRSKPYDDKLLHLLFKSMISWNATIALVAYRDSGVLHADPHGKLIMKRRWL